MSKQPFNNSPDLLTDWRAGSGQTVRYNAVDKPLSLLQSIILLFRYGSWHRTQRSYEPVYPSQPGYADAIFETTILYDRREMGRLEKLAMPTATTTKGAALINQTVDGHRETR